MPDFNIHEKHLIACAKQMKKLGIEINIRTLTEFSGFRSVFANRVIDSNKNLTIALLKIANRKNIDNEFVKISENMFEGYYRLTDKFKSFIEIYNKGETNKSKISKELGISRVTVYSYLKRISVLTEKL